MKFTVGVDVGTASVRAALVQSDGTVVATETKSIKIWNPQPDFYEQSSEEIWEAVCFTVKSVVSKGDVSKQDVVGIGFDATCSLVVMDTEGKPLSVSPTGNPACNIIMWMDHRAKVEADTINATNHDVLKYTGGVISLEMEPPKLMWLKKNLRENCWNKAGHFFDLCDFLTWKATGSVIRSQCSVVAKWTYGKVENGKGGFSKEFYSMIGLEDLIANNFQKIGSDVQPLGIPCGTGLSGEASIDLDLDKGMVVAVSVIDAHCGSIGCLGCVPSDASITVPPMNSRMVIISGTSTCHMAVNENPIFVPGIWGPMWSTIIPGLWCTEGGQSATGKLIPKGHYRSYSPTAMTAAYQKVKEMNCSIRKTAREYGVPEATLRNRLTGYVNPEATKSGPTPFFTQEEEARISSHLKFMASAGYGYSRAVVIDLASDYAVSLGYRNREHPFSLQWYSNFMSRWPDLKVLKPRGLQIQRAKATSAESISRYFTELETILRKYDLLEKPERIYNVDEKGISTLHKPPHVVCETGTKPPSMTSGTRANVTGICCGNAVGHHVPPYLIFPGVRMRSELLRVKQLVLMEQLLNLGGAILGYSTNTFHLI